MKKSIIFVTGGHLTPAIATIQEITDSHAPHEIVFVGRKFAMEGDKVYSEEFRLITSMHIRFLALTTGRLRRYVSIGTLVSLFKVPIGFIQSLVYCLLERPCLIVSFGGYIAFPVVISGWILGIPTITHEQTMRPGLANIVIAFFARRICVAFDKVARQFPDYKTVVTGLPIRQEIFHPPPRPSFHIPLSKKIIYITGGATGSEALNELIFPLTTRLISDFTLVHQTGARSLAKAISVRDALHSEQYIPLSYVDAGDHAWLLHHSSILISRAGANIVGEIMALGRVAIFIPLYKTQGEQYLNSQLLVQNGSAEFLSQEEATPDKILSHLKKIMSNIKIYTKNATFLSRTFPRNGSKLFVHELLKLV